MKPQKIALLIYCDFGIIIGQVKTIHSVVGSAAGTPGEIPVGRATRVGDIVAARAACTLQ